MNELRYRSHTALKFTAGLLRAFSVLTFVGFFLVAFGLSNLRPGPTPFGQMAGMGTFVGVVLIVIGFVYAVVLWALADVLILMADGDDAHRLMLQRIERLETLPNTVPPVEPPPVATEIPGRPGS